MPSLFGNSTMAPSTQPMQSLGQGDPSMARSLAPLNMGPLQQVTGNQGLGPSPQLLQALLARRAQMQQMQQMQPGGTVPQGPVQNIAPNPQLLQQLLARRAATQQQPQMMMGG